MNSWNQPNRNLTRREKEILKLLAAGLPAKEMADKLGIAVSTANRHLQHIYQKLHAKNRIDAARFYDRRIRIDRKS